MSVSPIAAGLSCRCPQCGEGRLFKPGLTLDLETSCPNCGLSYRFIDTGDGPAVFAIFLLGFAMLGAALIVEFGFEPPMWVHAILWIPATFFLAFGLLRPLKGLLIALQFRHKAAQGRLADD